MRDSKEILQLGLGIQVPWQLVDQRLDTPLWRIVQHYVAQAVARFDLSAVKAVGVDETASKRGHNYVTIFIDRERRKEPVLFATPGRGKDTVEDFAQFLTGHGVAAHYAGPSTYCRWPNAAKG